MGKIFDFIKSLPKAAQVLLLVAVFGGLAAGMGYMLFGKRGGEPVEEQRPAVFADIPDAADQSSNLGKLEEMRKQSRSQQSSVNSYWESLGGDVANDGGLLATGGGLSPAAAADPGYLDPSVYSEYEIYLITSGAYTKQEIDARHEDETQRQRAEEQERVREQREREDRERREDSLYYARLEQSYRLAEKYSGGTRQTAPKTSQPAAPAEPEPRKIDVQPTSTIPSTVLAEDGIITSLESGGVGGVRMDAEGKPMVTPVKATFLKTEQLVSGQRVIMRLMQDLHLSDGTVIPSNTHVSGTCKVGGRLNIEITTINYGGRIYYVNLDIYDNDGTEGIYCPVIVQNQAANAKKRIGRQAASTAAQVLSGAVGNRYTSALTASAMNNIVQTIDSNGNVSVSVSAGYEFYIFENVKKN